MKLLLPLSYFTGMPKSEIWQLDTDTGERDCIYTLPHTRRAIEGKGLTGLAWLSAQQLVACDANRLLLLRRDDMQIIHSVEDEQFNDLHHVSVMGNKIFLVNTGRDSIDVFDHQLHFIKRIEAPLLRDMQHQKLTEIITEKENYYDQLDSCLPFHRRKIRDLWHFNHITEGSGVLQGRVVSTSLVKRQLIDTYTMEVLSETLPASPHDGVIHNDAIWVTTVSGKIYRAPLTQNAILPLRFKEYFDLFDQAPFKGWCRGLLFLGNSLFVGITVIREKNRRTSWLDVPVKDTRTGIYRISLNTLSIEKFYDFSHDAGSRIFSLLEDR